jgi:hypothetical protein
MTMSITLTSASSPRWADESHSAILLDCTFAHLVGPVLFRATPDDPEAHGRAIYQRAVDLEFGAVAEPD